MKNLILILSVVMLWSCSKEDYDNVHTFKVQISEVEGEYDMSLQTLDLQGEINSIVNTSSQTVEISEEFNTSIDDSDLMLNMNIDGSIKLEYELFNFEDELIDSDELDISGIYNYEHKI